MKTFHCDQCGQQVFFENVACESCLGMLGYQPDHQTMGTFALAPDGSWRSLNPAHADQRYRKCRNYADEGVCNWMVSADSPDQVCASCELTQVIPALSIPKNRVYWQRMEAAKRRLLYTLWHLNMRPVSKSRDARLGLAFQFLEDGPSRRVRMGHANGLITLNVAEADPSQRERIREQLGEPYRTLLGHFRHESGHYYFEQLVVHSHWHSQFRALFGDERAPYGQALREHYHRQQHALRDVRFISRYASAHPWEDWAETWAHFLHMIETLDTAFWCGMTVQPRHAREPTLTIHQNPQQLTSFQDLMTQWLALTSVLNSLNRSIGMPDPYPFSLSEMARQKLEFVFNVVREHCAVPATSLP